MCNMHVKKVIKMFNSVVRTLWVSNTEHIFNYTYYVDLVYTDTYYVYIRIHNL